MICPLRLLEWVNAPGLVAVSLPADLIPGGSSAPPNLAAKPAQGLCALWDECLTHPAHWAAPPHPGHRRRRQFYRPPRSLLVARFAPGGGRRRYPAEIHRLCGVAQQRVRLAKGGAAGHRLAQLRGFGAAERPLGERATEAGQLGFGGQNHRAWFCRFPKSKGRHLRLRLNGCAGAKRRGSAAREAGRGQLPYALNELIEVGKGPPPGFPNRRCSSEPWAAPD